MSELIDRQALKDAVRRYADEPIKAKDKKCQAICLDMLGTIDAQPAASPWHRVEERLPNVDEEVLVFAVGKLDGFIGDTVIALTSMSDTNWLNYHKKVDEPYWLDPWQYFLTDYRITHWMPLPEPPKEDA